MQPITIERLASSMQQEATREAPPEGFPTLPRIPGSRYKAPDFLALEHAAMWRRAWLYACHLDEIPAPGAFYVFRRLGVAILVVHGQDGVIRAFHNICRHRGAPLADGCQGKVSGFVCRYHGWTYGLDGRLLKLRDRRDFGELDLAAHSLASVRCERLGHWIFINEDPQAPPLLDSLGPVVEHFAQVQPEHTRLVHRRSYPIRSNVKTAMEAFLEVYHLKCVHPKTADRFLDHRGTSITLWPNGHSLMLTPNRDPAWRDPGSRGMPAFETATMLTRHNNPSYNVFPNLITPLDATGVPFLLFWPTGERSMEIEVIWFAPRDKDHALEKQWTRRIENFERILQEDIDLLEHIQGSVDSPAFDGITPNYQERRIYHWHEELDRRIGAEHIPDAHRVRPVLGPWISREG